MNQARQYTTEKPAAAPQYTSDMANKVDSTYWKFKFKFSTYGRGHQASWKRPKNNIRSNVCNILSNTRRNTNERKSKKERELDIKIKETKIFLKNSPQICILKPDKCNKTVIMNTADYEQKITDLLNDNTTYKLMDYHPTKYYQRKYNNFVKKLITDGHIEESVGKKLITCNAQPPRIYGLPKLHSWIFKNKIDNIPIPSHYQIVLPDVISLYKNIPLDVLSNVLQKNWNKIKVNTDIPLNIFLEITQFILNLKYYGICCINYLYFSFIQCNLFIFFNVYHLQYKSCCEFCFMFQNLNVIINKIMSVYVNMFTNFRTTAFLSMLF